MKKKITSVVALAVSATIGLSMPANAAPYDAAGSVPVGPESGYWNFDSLPDASLQAAGNDTWENNGDGDDAWDDTYAYLLGSNSSSTQMTCAVPADLSEATDASGDWILTCDPQDVSNDDGDLVVTTEFRFYADGKTVRRRYIIANESNTTVSGQIFQVQYNAYQDASTSVSWTALEGMVGDWSTDYGSTTEFITTADDYIWVTDDREALDTNAPVVKYAVGSADSSAPLLNTDPYTSGVMGDGDDRGNLYYALPDLAPGDVVEILTMAKVYLFNDGMDNDINMNGWEEGTEYAVGQAVIDTDLESDEYVFAGIDDTSRVINWGDGSGAANSGGSGLAATGFDAAPLGTIALFAITGGVAMIVRRRAIK